MGSDLTFKIVILAACVLAGIVVMLAYEQLSKSFTQSSKVRTARVMAIIGAIFIALGFATGFIDGISAAVLLSVGAAVFYLYFSQVLHK